MFRNIFLLIFLVSFSSVFQSELIAQTPYVSSSLFTPTSDIRPITIDPERTVGLDLDKDVFESLRNNYPEKLNLRLPDFNGGEIEVQFEQFDAFPATVTVGIHSKEGYEEIDYVPRIKTYKVIGGTGSLVLMIDHVIGTFQWEGTQIEIKPATETSSENTDVKHLLRCKFMGCRITF